VLPHVGQRLLDHPVGGQADALGQRPRLALQRERHRPARRPGLLQQVPQLVKAGLRGQVGGLVVGPQYAEQPPHLGQRLSAGGRDRGQRLPGPLRLAGQRVAGPVRLDHHHADVVRHHVVQFAGDPGPLGRRADLRLDVALALQPRRPVSRAT
jgi:hypothetical protein